MINNYLEAIKKRRSYYGLSKDVNIADEKLEEIIESVHLRHLTPKQQELYFY